MSIAAIATTGEAAPERRLGRVVDRLLVWLPTLTAVAAVAAYLTIHRELVQRPGGELLAALAAGARVEKNYWTQKSHIQLSYN